MFTAYYKKMSVSLSVRGGAQIMQDQQTEQQEEQLPGHIFVPGPEDATDCMQCLILMYGETHINTLTELLNLTAYAESEYSHLCVLRQR